MNGGMNKRPSPSSSRCSAGCCCRSPCPGRFTSYVKPGFAPLLLIGGGILVVVGVLSLVLAIRVGPGCRPCAQACRTPSADAGFGRIRPSTPGTITTRDDAHGHDHAASKAPWLILVPVLVLLLVAPPALGADAVARNATLAGRWPGWTWSPSRPASNDGAGGGGGYKFNDGSGSAEDSTGSRRTMHFPALDGTEPRPG